jgi:hypothetical protein
MAAMTSSFVGKALAVKVNKISKVRARKLAEKCGWLSLESAAHATRARRTPPP